MSLSQEVKQELLNKAGKFTTDFTFGLLNYDLKGQLTRPQIYIRDKALFEHIASGLLSSTQAGLINSYKSQTLTLSESASFSPVSSLSDYLAGFFITSGYLNKSLRHLELHAREASLANSLRRFLSEHEIVSSLRFRDGKYIIYIVLVEDIFDFFKLIGAHNHVLSWEERRLTQNFKTQLQRSTNLDVSNQSRLANSSLDFKRLYSEVTAANLARQFTEHEIDFFNLKRQNPHLSLADLIIMFNRKNKTRHTRSAANHWLLKLRRIYNTFVAK